MLFKRFLFLWLTFFTSEKQCPDTEPGLEQWLGGVGRLQPKHVLFFDVVRGAWCQRMMNADGTGWCAERCRTLFETALVFVQI